MLFFGNRFIKPSGMQSFKMAEVAFPIVDFIVASSSASICSLFEELWPIFSSRQALMGSVA